MSQTVRVNFGDPVPLFPLRETVLLPHAVQPLHVFEARYRQMVEDALQSSSLIAMSCYEDPLQAKDPLPQLRPAVCIGKIIQHERLEDGRHNILLHGVCRAMIQEQLGPDGERLYRMARLRPIEAPDPTPCLDRVRRRMKRVLRRPMLKRSVRSVGTVLEWFDRDDIPTYALLELVGFTLVQDQELKYALLAEAHPERRAALISDELVTMDRVLRMVDTQHPDAWPKGMSWN